MDTHPWAESALSLLSSSSIGQELQVVDGFIETFRGTGKLHFDV